MNDTIFEKIIRGEIPATKIYEDGNCFAFLDIQPVTKGHTLLIPKIPYGRMQDVPDDTIALLFIQAKKIVQSMIAGLPCDYVHIVVEGAHIPDHFHIHLIPRYNGQEVATWQHTTYESGEEIGEYAQKISKAL